MTHLSTRIRLASALGAAALTVTLVSCAGGEQSVADGCSVANETVTEATGDIGTYLTEVAAGEDPEVALEPINEALTQAKDEVQNSEVAEALTNMDTELKALTEQMESVEFPDVTAIDPTDAEALAKYQEQLAAVEEDAAAIREQSAKLQEAGLELAEICSAG